MTGGLALTPLMRELLGLLDTEWKTVNQHAYPRRTARALANRGLAQITDPLQSPSTYQVRLTAGGEQVRQCLIANTKPPAAPVCTCDYHPSGYDAECPVHRQPELELNPTWVGNFPAGY